jgi:GT2 family glycosyltransferase
MTPASVVTVIHDSGDVVGEMIATLPSTLELVVVDNASSDGGEAVVRRIRSDVMLVALTENVGFGRGCNEGVRHSSGEVLVFLNPDCRPEPGAIERLVAEAQADPWSIFGPAMLNLDGTLRYNLRRRSRPLHEILESLPSAARWVPARWRRDMPGDDPLYRDGGDVEYLQGACLAVDRTAFSRAGGFDEDFFLYSEEETLCAAIRSSGGRCVYVAEARVRHAGGTSTAKRSEFAIRHAFRSRAIFYRKRYGEFTGQLSVAAIAASVTLSWMLAPLAVLLKTRASKLPRVQRYALQGLYAGARYRFGRL